MNDKETKPKALSHTDVIKDLQDKLRVSELENAGKRSVVDSWMKADEINRREITAMLTSYNSYTRMGGSYGYERDRGAVVYTWPQIFFEVGKLVAKRDYVEFGDRLSGMENTIINFDNELRKVKDDRK